MAAVEHDIASGEQPADALEQPGRQLVAPQDAQDVRGVGLTVAKGGASVDEVKDGDLQDRFANDLLDSPSTPSLW